MVNDVSEILYNRIKHYTIPVNVFLNKEYNTNRKNMLILLGKIIYSSDVTKNLSKNEKDNIIYQIELSCYNTTLKKCDELMYIKSWDEQNFNYLYHVISCRVTKNLDINSEVKSNYLISQVKNKNIKLQNIALMSSDELCPEKSEKIKEKIQHRTKQKIIYKKSHIYTCKNCKHKEVTVETVQIRALDEGSNYSLTCTFCNNNWII